jgi:hypothetical protein
MKMNCIDSNLSQHRGAAPLLRSIILTGVLALCSLSLHAQNLTVTNSLQLWLKADAGITTNTSGAVTAWADQSGKANNAAQPDEAAAPKLVTGALNGKPVVRFDGDDDYLDVATSLGLEIVGDISSYFVVKFDDFANFRAVWGKTLVNIPAATDYYVTPTGVPRLYRGSGIVSDIGAVDATIVARAETYILLGFQVAGTTVTHYLNGQAVGTGEIRATLVDGATPLKIGSRDDLFTKMKGDIAELVIFDSALSDTERGSVVNYLQTKYGIKNLPPTINLTLFSPGNNPPATAPANLTVIANAADSDGSIARVQFFANGSLLGTATASPFRVPVTVQTAGTITFTATATDNKDGVTTSAPINVTVTGGAAASLTVTNGLQLWLKADAGVTKDASGAVTAWADQSGKNNNAVQADPTLAPILVDSAVNGKAALRFDGADDYLDVASTPSTEIIGDIASFFVVKFDDFASFRAVWGKTAANLPRPTDYYLLPNSGIPRVYRGSGDANVNAFVDGAGGVAAGAYVLLGFSHSGNVMSHYLNGQAFGSGAMTVIPTDGGAPLKIGTRDDLFTKMKGDIAELLIFDRGISGDEQSSLAVYLAGKYGIPVIQSANTPPTISLSGIANGASVAIPTNLVVTAASADADGSIAKVEFFANGGLIGSATAAPYKAELKVVSSGDIALTAVATDNLGAKTTSPATSIKATAAGASLLPATASLKLWLRADGGVTTNAAGAVTAWADFSGNFNNAVQSNTNAAPQFIANATNQMPALRFDGVNDYLEIAHSASLAITGDITSFFVVKFDDFATFRAVWAKTANNLPRPTDYYLLPNSGIPRLFRGGPAGIASVDAAEPFPAGTFVVAGFDTAATVVTHYLNGQVIGTGEILPLPVDVGSPIRVGTRGDLVTKMKGDIGEIVIYNTALSEADRNKVIDYLTAKYFTAAQSVRIGIRLQANSIVIEWAAGASLEEAAQITGPWTTVNGAASPHTTTPSGQQKFYRVRL